MQKHRTKGDWLGKLIGILTFLGGIALLLLTFRLAFDMFNVPPDQALHLERGKVLDIPVAAQSFGLLLLRVLLLVVMGLMGSMVANRGIRLYSDCVARVVQDPVNKPDETP